MVRWYRVNFQCGGVLPIYIIVGQGPTMLAVGASGVVWAFFSRLSFLSSSSLSGRRPDIDLNTVSKGLKPKPTNEKI